MKDISALSKTDPRYQCTIATPQPKVLKAREHAIMKGHFAWAYVPNRNGVKRQVVFIADNEPRVETLIIENIPR